MSKNKLKLYQSGILNVLKGDTMKAAVTAKAEEITSRACDMAGKPDAYAHKERYAKRRVIAYIYPKSDDGKRDNAENNTLLRAMK